MSVLDYIPQRLPVVMVDSFEGIDDVGSHSSFTVPPECIFLDNGVLDECALVENLAQSAALRVGWLCKEAGREVPLGFIGAVDKCRFEGVVKVGDTLKTTVTVAAEVGGVTLAEAWSEVHGTRICSATLKIFLQ